MKPSRDHVASGEYRANTSSQTRYYGALAATGAAVVAAAAGAAAALPAVIIPAGVIAVASGLYSLRKRHELTTWGFPELALSIDMGNGDMLPLAPGGNVRFGDTIVGNYSRRSNVSPLPEATLTAHLVATEHARQTSHNESKTFEKIAINEPALVTPHVNDGRLDIDFSVSVPVHDAPSTFSIDDANVTWSLQLRLATKGPDDVQTFDLTVAPRISDAAPQPAPTPGTHPAWPPGTVDQPFAIMIDAPDAEVGTAIGGRVRWHETVMPRQILVSLMLRIEGRGNPVKKTVVQATVPVTSMIGETSFLLDLDQSLPPSYRGKLFTVEWSVDARMDLKRRKDPRLTAPVRLRPTGWFAEGHRDTNTLPIIDPDARPNE